MKTKNSFYTRGKLLVLFFSSFAVTGCATMPGWLPSSGASREQVQAAETERIKGIQLVDVDDVKKVVEHLKQAGRSEHEFHTRVLRPWGWYEGIDKGDRFQVKRISVNPGASLSLQMHYHRAEHWVVVRGTAEVTRDGETFFVSENESTYIPVGVKHRLANPGKVPLEIIEVQSGSYLGEDDIVRFDDRYGRHA